MLSLGKALPFNETFVTLCCTPKMFTLANALVSLYVPLADAYRALFEAVNYAYMISKMCTHRHERSSPRPEALNFVPSFLHRLHTDYRSPRPPDLMQQ